MLASLSEAMFQHSTLYKMEMMSKVAVSFAFIGAIVLFLRLYNALVLQPRRLRSALRKQGLTGPPPTPVLGNILDIKRSIKEAKNGATTIVGPQSSHNCQDLIFPFLVQWIEKYGDVFMFSLGTTQIMYVNQVEMLREITTSTSLDLGKPTYQAKERGALLGKGILTSNGEYWAYQRKVIAPELYLDKVKGMIHLIEKSSMAMINSWKSIVEDNGGLAEIKIAKYMRSFSGDVISKACFGSNYSKGELIFLKLRALQEASSKKVFNQIPGLRHLPTKNNREKWALEKDVKKLILDIVEEREKGGVQMDLLQMLLEGVRNGNMTSQDAVHSFIVDNCKNIYLAGYETTAVSAMWCLMLLASNPEWQSRIREEVLGICEDRVPNEEMIRKMKQLTMVINETLRLYPPVTIISREVFKDMKFGNINVPNGVNIWTLVTKIHTDPEIWGPDSYQFRPERFANGITGACKFPHLYMPFGIGPRICLGQNLALLELKMLISLILSHFSFSLSPSYIHSPVLNLILEPRHGVDLLIQKL